ncbi:MAG: ABC transporter ATP-binding protein [Flavobacteriales bacterium]|nr:ABC transporter ATP-binding protein [Flavobacteriales bacterium]
MPTSKTNKKDQAKKDSIIGFLLRVFALLSNEERKKSGLLLSGIVVNSFVDLLGLAAVIPVIGLVVNPSVISTNTFLAEAYQLSHYIGINSEKSFLILLCAIMAGAFLFKALFGLLINLFQARFSFSVAHRISGNMWDFHFMQSLEKMRSKESGKILVQINSWPITLARTFIVGSLLLINEFLIIIIIGVGLLIYNPLVFIGLALILLLGVIVIRSFTKKKLGNYSDTLNKISPRTNTLITNSIKGFLELITFRAVKTMKEEYLKDVQQAFLVMGNTTIINFLPSKLYEVLAVTALSAAIIISLLLTGFDAGFFELLTLLALSAYRIMPSMSRLNASLINMQSQSYVLTAMELGNSNEKTETLNRNKDKLRNAINIQVSELSLGYETLERLVLDNLNCTFPSGKLNAIVGPSGCGKSTLINALMGIHPYENGSILFTDHSSNEVLHTKENLSQTAYLSQQPFLFNGTVLENLTLRVPGVSIDEKKVMELIQRLKLDQCLGHNPLEFVLSEGGQNLSGGEQQRLAILRAIQINRPVLILDEATSALDVKMRDIVIRILHEEAANGVNVVIVSHDEELASQCDTVLKLEAPNA